MRHVYKDPMRKSYTDHPILSRIVAKDIQRHVYKKMTIYQPWHIPTFILVFASMKPPGNCQAPIDVRIQISDSGLMWARGNT